MVERAISAGWTFLDAIGKLWPILVGGIMLVGYCYTLDGRVTDQQQQLAAMSQQNLAARVLTLENDRANDSANTTAQFQSLQAQMTALSAKDEQLIAQVSQQSQTIATESAQITFLIQKDYPGTKVAP